MIMLKCISTILCVNILFCENVSSSQTLFDDARRLIHFVNNIFAHRFTIQEEKLYDVGSQLPSVSEGIDKLMLKYGYPVEQYEVTTEDGYILRVFHVRGRGGVRGRGPAVLLVHGLRESADDWATAGPESGLAYLLAAEGCDVWLANVRGNKHSGAHAELPPDSAAYWDFSWDEMGRYDLPATIDLILRVSTRSRLVYVGHSQGTTAFFVMAAERPDYARKIHLMVALAPVAAIPNLKNPIVRLIFYGTLGRPDFLFSTLRKVGVNSLSSKSIVTEIIASIASLNSRISRDVCNLIFLMADVNFSQANFTTLPTVLSHLTSKISVKQIQHYAQTVTYDRFARFHYGAVKNKMMYGSKVPPEYNISAITTPIAMYYSANDWLAAETDVHILRKKLKSVIKFYKVPNEKFTHIDFMYAKDLQELVYKSVLELIVK